MTGGASSQQENLNRWDRLPVHIWDRIFSLLPISTLVISKTVCRSWKLTIQSQTFISSYPTSTRPNQDLYFLLFAHLEGATPFVAAYHPSRDKWINFSLSRFSCSAPACCNICRPHVSDGALLLIEQQKGSLLVCNPFTRVYRVISSMFSVSHAKPYAIGLIEEGSSRYKIVAVFLTPDRVFSQVYDSEIGSWVMKGQLAGGFAVLGNSAYVDGHLYCLSYGPNCLLEFDPVSGEWSLVDVVMPNVVYSHVLVHLGVLFLVGGITGEVGDIFKIGIWELDRVEKQWREICFMPEPLFRQFRGFRMFHFVTVHRMGKICFYNTRKDRLLMYDLSGIRWWWPPPCPFKNSGEQQKYWFGHALEPRVEAVL